MVIGLGAESPIVYYEIVLLRQFYDKFLEYSIIPLQCFEFTRNVAVLAVLIDNTS